MFLPPLRPPQQKIYDELLSRSSTHLLWIAPTGSGKGYLLEWIASVHKENLKILLICPLIALGRQFYQRVSKIHSKVCFGMDGQSADLASDCWFWILSPELLQSDKFLEKAKSWKPDLIVIDECHCIVEWGNDFRPSYGKLPEILSKNFSSKTLWMTATFPRRDLRRIEDYFPSLKVVGSFRIPEKLKIYTRYAFWSERLLFLDQFLRKKSNGGILFTPTRSMTEKIYSYVLDKNHNGYYYHAGLSKEERVQQERRILRDPKPVVVSTSAFGMGMDYPHLQWVVLLSTPSSLLGMMQSWGRVARNEMGGEAYCLWNESDFREVSPAVIDFLNSESRSAQEAILRNELL